MLSCCAWTWDLPTITAFVSAMLGSILMWWIYFDTGAQRAQHRIASAGDPGRTARSAYTYVHIVIVAGIIVCAVADEIVLMHPGHGTDAGLLAILGRRSHTRSRRSYAVSATTLVFAVVACWETIALSAQRQASAVTH